MKEEISYKQIRLNNDYEDFWSGAKATYIKKAKAETLKIGRTILPLNPTASFTEWQKYINLQLKQIFNI